MSPPLPPEPADKTVLGASSRIDPAAPAPVDPPDTMREFGHFRLMKELGRGAQGVVFLAEDTKLARKVALKMLAGSASLDERSRFQREAEITSKLEHPGICGVYEVGEVDGVPFLAMQFVRGSPLATLIEENRAAGNGGSTSLFGNDRKGDMQDIVRLVEHAARALHVAHEAGLIHRDIKPGNIMVTPEGLPVILDFGLARDLDSAGATLTQSGQILGTPSYLAPEQIAANRAGIDRRTDIYALGVTLYECVTLQRPFTGTSWDTLFHEILEAVPPDPRRLNPRVPRDLRTVIEVAMDREQKRRYQTALDLAEDLRRVRSLEPIRAKGAGPVRRLRKWSQRHPGIASSLVASGLLVLVLGGYFGNEALAHARAMRADLDAARGGMTAGDFGTALAAIARAETRDPSSTETLRLKDEIQKAQLAAEREHARAADLRAADDARRESLESQERYAATRNRIAEHRRALLAARGEAFARGASEQARERCARLEGEIGDLELDEERFLREAESALNRAARHESAWGGPSAETRAAYASFFLERWREALASGDTVKLSVFRALVEQHDPDGAHREELLGRGTLQVTVDPPAAAVWLFRMEPIRAVQADAIPRLVPVPTRGLGTLGEGEWPPGFRPGAGCRVVTSVETGSAAARAGLRPGDLVLSTGTASPEQPAGGPSGDAAVIQVVCLHDGEPVTLEVPAGGDAGIASRATANPLACTAANRVQPGEPLPVDPGSYLLVARAAGFEEQRLPVLVARHRAAAPRIALLPEGAVPPGFVFVPPGEFPSGGDPRAANPRPVRSVDPGGFFISRFEVTNAEWFAFVNDPETLAKIEADPAHEVYLPRNQRDGLFVRRLPDGKGFTWHDRAEGYTSTADTPVMGVSWSDARDYVAWRNRRAVGRGEGWVFDLPSEVEWEKAARGVDGRAFPWGDRFDFALAVSGNHEGGWLYHVPVGYAPRDESPYGVRDLAGSRSEWLRDLLPGDATGQVLVRGGHWGANSEQAFRCASRGYAQATQCVSTMGLRLVARPRE